MFNLYETIRAQSAETTLYASHDNENARSAAAELVLGNSVASEANRAS